MQLYNIEYSSLFFWGTPISTAHHDHNLLPFFPCRFDFRFLKQRLLNIIIWTSKRLVIRFGPSFNYSPVRVRIEQGVVV